MILSTTIARARKGYLCDLCCQAISPRERYQRQTSVTDDGFDVWTTCGRCTVVMWAWFENVACNGDVVDFGCIDVLIEDLTDIIGADALKAITDKGIPDDDL